MSGENRTAASSGRASTGRPVPGDVPAESDLCVSCGMCCDGTFLDWAPVLPDDDLRGLQRVGHPVQQSDERGDHFALPCPALVDTCCTVYGHRPSICSTYRCALLEAFARDDVDGPAALGIIESTLEVRDRVRIGIARRLDSSVPRSLSSAYAALTALHDGSADPVAARRADADLLLDVALLRRLLSRHFEEGDVLAQPLEMPIRRP